MSKWQRFRAQEEVLTMAHLAQIASKGWTIEKVEDAQDVKLKNLGTKLPLQVHDRLDAIAESIPGMTKDTLVKFILDAGIFEFCKAYLNETLFPPEQEEMNSADSLIDEALAQFKAGRE